MFLSAKYAWKYDKGSSHNENDPKFKYITHDTASSYMNYKAVQVGDVIFMDWDNGSGSYGADGHIDHTLIVTKIQTWRPGYNKIQVASNSNYYRDKGLGDINEDYDKKALFYVYRPVAYVQK